MRIIKLILSFFVFVFMYSCKPEAVKFTINGNFNNGNGKYIKYIDMTKPGLNPDSIEIDLGGKFILSQECKQYKDFLFYFNPNQAIRIIVGPKKVLGLTGDANNLITTYKVTGSKESILAQQIITKNYHSIHVLDTLNNFYLKSQMHPNFDSIVQKISHLADSIYISDKEYYQHFIENQPGTFASYIALSQKLNRNHNFFTVKNDLPYFEMVDTALMSRYDTIDVVKMLHVYILRSKSRANQQKTKKIVSMIGKVAPEISLPNLRGDTLNLSALKGKYVLIDFWGSWCRPCRNENKNLRDNYKKYRYKGFEIYQVALERNKTDWKNTIREDKLYWRNQVSELNYMESHAARSYNVKGLPANFIINPEGVIIAENLFGQALTDSLTKIFTIKK